jgi:NAD(P)-dependent dehydrogenase (short-subunit alcohol dehydrogenase family)
MENAMKLDNKVAIVTGAARGIGLACAEEFAAHGAHVMLSDVLEDQCDSEARRIAQEFGVKTESIRCDVANKQDVDNLITETLNKFGTLDIAVANAGIAKAGTILDLDAEDFDEVLAINLRGVFLTGQAAAKVMVAKGVKGSIVNMSSTNAVVAIPNQLAYVTSKGGVSQLTKAMAIGLAEHGIRVNAIGPGSIMTDILRSVAADKTAMRELLSRTPLRRIGKPDEVGKVAVFLSSEYASYITGQTIYPDGGRLALNITVPVEE